ncbi:MAG: YeeE/YedE family protein [Ignavibacteria bacterium]|nr:YeeE/YedE family protein [Ignavibacteria bacterium]
MFELLKQPWHWALSGTLIGLIVPLLLILGNKKFGISSSFRHICASCFPGNVKFFKYEWKKEIWNLFFVGGIIIGAFIATVFLTDPASSISIAPETVGILNSYGISDFSSLMPVQLFNWSNLFSMKGLVFFIMGGFLVGFGTRYAGGCTSGHSIMGLANLQKASLIATIFFMAGGFFSTNILIPLIFKYLQ